MATKVAVDHPDAVFLVAGEGALLSEMMMQARALGERVRFTPWRPDVATLYAAADIVVLSSDNEGMPVVLIEGSLAGRPCVTTDVGGHREVVEHGRTGFVTERDPKALAEGVGRLLADPQMRARIGGTRQPYPRQHFGVARSSRTPKRSMTPC